MKLSKRFSLPWLADFRDPWTNIDFYKDLLLTRRADKKHHKLELKVLKNASYVSVISQSMAEEFNTLYQRQYDVITNGYDPADVAIPDKIQLDKKFSIAHIGTLVKTRNPNSLWKALVLLLKEDKQFSSDLEIKLVGKMDISVQKSIMQHDLMNYVNKIDYLPHDEVVKIQQQSQVLLLLINNTPNAKVILTGKFFEYMAAKRPVICIGPVDGDAAKVLDKTNTGHISDFKDVNTLKMNIRNYYNKYKLGQLVSESKEIEKFSRKELTGRVAGLLS